MWEIPQVYHPVPQFYLQLLFLCYFSLTIFFQSRVVLIATLFHSQVFQLNSFYIQLFVSVLFYFFLNFNVMYTFISLGTPNILFQSVF